MQPGVIVVWWIACLLWSGTFLAIKAGVGDVPPWTFAWVRLALALAILVPIAAGRRGFSGLRRGDVVPIMVAGVVLLGVNYALLYWGAQFITSGLVAILQSATPVIALGLGWILGTETIGIRKVAAVAAGVVGVATIFGTEARASGVAGMLGAAAVVGSSACVASAYVWLKGRQKRLPTLTVTTLQCLAAIGPLAAVALGMEGSPFAASWSPRSVAAAIYLAIAGSVVAFWLNYWLLERMDASAMLMMGVAEVPIAVALGALIFGERLPPGTYAGAVCVLAGVILGPVTSSPSPTPAPDSSASRGRPADERADLR
jgi:drug/metabolite transporter (DMT)-like permease